LDTNSDIALKPRTLNFMVNDICNSRCKMCNVWKRKKEKELTPEELRSILADPLFSELEYVGVSGGEPTLRSDLDQMFVAFVSSVKSLKGIGLITNALNRENVLGSIDKVAVICKQHDVPFNVMVSLDGIGPVHDSVRGREGSFDSAVHVLRHLRDETDIPVSIGCTIIKENIWYVDDVLQFCRDENIHGRFRIGEFIDRLYNEDLNDQIRNFDDDERYQLALFFSKVCYSYESAPTIRATYSSIIDVISEALPRSSGCPYRHSAISMDCTGNILYCSPKSPKVGSSLEKSAYEIYFTNLGIRQEIIDRYCSSCIHDYHDAPSPLFLDAEAHRAEWTEKLSISNALKLAKTIVRPPVIAENYVPKKALIIGWYGTETSGDKAILDEIIFHLRERHQDVQITVASLYPFVTKRTLKELKREDICVVATYSDTFLETCRNADAVIMGGGPLMGMEPLGFVLAAFSEASKVGVPTVIEGCGIGPIHEDAHITALKEILRLASIVRVRDTESLAWIYQNTDRRDAICMDDPAAGFVLRNKRAMSSSPQQTIACFLRQITNEYMDDMSIDEFQSFRQKFEEELGKLVRYMNVTTGLKLLLMPMHTFAVGNDDRDFARNFAREHLVGCDYTIGDRIYSPQDILLTMQKSRLSLCMRFHSVLFADVLNIPYIPIDYTGGGKTMAFLKDRDKLEKYIDRKTVAEGSWQGQVDRVLSGYKRKVHDHEVERSLMLLQLIHDGKRAIRNYEAEHIQLKAQLKGMRADREIRDETYYKMIAQLKESEADRAARLELIHSLDAQLKESEADRAARLELIHSLDAQLKESEVGRAASIAAISKIQSSFEWKITAPFRWLRRHLPLK